MSASRTLKLRLLLTVVFWETLILGFGFPFFFLFTVVFAVLMIYVRTKGVIDLHYDIEDGKRLPVDIKMNPMIKITECAKVWRITRTSKVINRKYSAGASEVVNRTACIVTTKPPFPFKTNVKVASFKSGKEILLFLPDKLFVIQGSNVGALSYDDIVVYTHTTRFIESEVVPKDAQVVDYTYQYVNKSGESDQRFRNNRRLPVCLYGELELVSTSGLNTIIMYSNPDKGDK